jgi:hypothetical protein
VNALARATLGDVELAEPGERHVTAALQGVLDRVEDGVNRISGFLLAQARAAGDLVDEL